MNQHTGTTFHDFSICQITTKNWSFHEDVVAYAEAGIKGIGIFRPKIENINLYEVRDHLLKNGLLAKSMISLDSLTGDAHVLDHEKINAHCKYIKECSVLGIQNLVVVPGNLNGRNANLVEDLTISALTELVPIAKSYGVTLALEPIRSPYFDFMNTLLHTSKIVKNFSPDSVGIVFDTWHLWDEPNLNNIVKDIINYISIIHVSDWRNGTSIHNDRMIPGEGNLPLNEIMRFVDSIGFNGLYEIEIYSEILWQSDYREIINKCNHWFNGLWTRH
ncbi:sugar phosphate isomerase/epimerase [Glaciimonas sp. PCH181]|uniref:sugar phosphate isomerase/epimerase family protein n=1 Tax=Glaciimonas sp. PCH181 TaxID=2133943 RepID=UPI000D35D626|nr:sugar phosphate isomerase/epimerase family protein [Glaciimonas sp. PCH181]PUA18431.1 hypothetical protein C7W93_00200 [Glaciimonas sp. PCH181]